MSLEKCSAVVMIIKNNMFEEGKRQKNGEKHIIKIKNKNKRSAIRKLKKKSLAFSFRP